METEKIIKGLEICVSVEENCDKCPYEGCYDCSQTLKEDTLALIRSQQAQIEELSNKHWGECRQIAHYSQEVRETLNKQIPKKPEWYYVDVDYGTKVEKCPCCGNVYIDEKDNYCSKCGQRIDWSGEK